jgi:hypothetical protein
MIDLKEDHDAILELDARGLLGMKFVQRGDGDFLPGLGLLGGERTWKKSQSRGEERPAQN